MTVGWRYGCASARLVQNCDGVVSYVVAGVLTAATLMALRDDAGREVAESGALALVIDLTNTVVTIAPGDLSIPPRPLVSMLPVAVVVTPDQVPLFAAYCLSMAKRGVVRATFTNAENACAWAQWQGQVLRDHREWKQARRLADQRSSAPDRRKSPPGAFPGRGSNPATGPQPLPVD